MFNIIHINNVFGEEFDTITLDLYITIIMDKFIRKKILNDIPIPVLCNEKKF